MNLDEILYIWYENSILKEVHQIAEHTQNYCYTIYGWNFVCKTILRSSHFLNNYTAKLLSKKVDCINEWLSMKI